MQIPIYLYTFVFLGGDDTTSSMSLQDIQSILETLLVKRNKLCLCLLLVSNEH